MKQNISVLLAVLVFAGMLAGCSLQTESISKDHLPSADENTLENGYLFMGGVNHSDLYLTTGYLAVEPNTTYVFSGFLTNGVDAGARFVTEYDSEKNVLTEHGIVKSITTGSGTCYVRFTVSAGEEAVADIQERAVTFSAPSTIYIDVGTPFIIHFSNVLTPAGYLMWFGQSEYLETKYYDDHLEVTALQEGIHDLPYCIYDENYREFASGVLCFAANDAARIEDTSVLLLGDSMTNSGVITQELMELFKEQGKTVTLLGTRGEGSNRYEGRGGWTAGAYMYAEARGEYENAFLHNGVFDFSNYMASQAYDYVDYVVIQLGTNDIFSLQLENYTVESRKVLQNFEGIIRSIHAYDPEIEIIISVTIPPTSQQAVFTENYGTQQLGFIFRHNMIRFALDLQEYFAAWENIYFAAANCVLDTHQDIRDGVHPTETGYKKMAKTIFDTIVYIQNN